MPISEVLRAPLTQIINQWDSLKLLILLTSQIARKNLIRYKIANQICEKNFSIIKQTKFNHSHS